MTMTGFEKLKNEKIGSSTNSGSQTRAQDKDQPQNISQNENKASQKQDQNQPEMIIADSPAEISNTPVEISNSKDSTITTSSMESSVDVDAKSSVESIPKSPEMTKPKLSREYIEAAQSLEELQALLEETSGVEDLSGKILKSEDLMNQIRQAKRAGNVLMVADVEGLREKVASLIAPAPAPSSTPENISEPVSAPEVAAETMSTTETASAPEINTAPETMPAPTPEPVSPIIPETPAAREPEINTATSESSPTEPTSSDIETIRSFFLNRQNALIMERDKLSGLNFGKKNKIKKQMNQIHEMLQALQDGENQKVAKYLKELVPAMATDIQRQRLMQIANKFTS